MTSDSGKDRIVSISFTLIPQIIIKLKDCNKYVFHILDTLETREMR